MNKPLLTISMMLIAASAQGQTIGLHVGSKHMPDRGQSNQNLGLYYRTSSGVEAGYYRNSYRRDAFYVGQRLKLVEGVCGSLGVDFGLITGYQRKCRNSLCEGFSRGYVTPMVAGDYLAPVSIFGVTPRLQFVPATKGNSAVVHLSAEYRL